MRARPKPNMTPNESAKVTVRLARLEKKCPWCGRPGERDGCTAYCYSMLKANPSVVSNTVGGES